MLYMVCQQQQQQLKYQIQKTTKRKIRRVEKRDAL